LNTDRNTIRKLARHHKVLESMIYHCESKEDLLILATILMTTSKNIFLVNAGRDKTLDAIKILLDDVVSRID
jgi:hypothetical protein